MANTDSRPQTIPDTTAEDERETIRESNDRDQEMEREGVTTRHNAGYDEAVRSRSRRTGRHGDTGPAGDQRRDVDPDSAESEVDRNDTVDDPH